MDQEKFLFLQQHMFEIAKGLQKDSPRKWGVMNAQQMLEHLADFFDVSYEKIIFPLVTPEEHLPKYKAFLYSDKEFRENTKAPATVLGDEPLPYRFSSIEEAQSNLEKSVAQFIQYFQENAANTTVHPVFGSLNFEEWILLHHKHVTHHFKQFGLINAE